MKSAFVLLLSLIVLRLPAQLTIGSLEEARNYALEHNRQLYRSELQEDIARKNYHLSWSALSPRASVNSSMDYNYALQTQLIPAEIFGGAPGTYVEARFGTPYNWTANLDVMMPVVNTTLWENINTGLRNKEISQSQTKQTVWATDEQLARAYYGTLISRQQMELLYALWQVQDSLYQSGEKKFRQGFIEQIELNRLHNLQLNASAQYENAVSTYKTSLDQLKYALGLDITQELTLTGSMPETLPSFSSGMQFQPDRYPAFTTVLLQERVAKINLKKEYFKMLPEVSFNMRYGRQAFRNEWDFFDSNKPWYETGYLGLRLEWPVFAGLSRWNTIRREQFNLKMAENEKLLRYQELVKEDRSLVLELEASGKVVTTHKEVFALSDENYRLALIKYAQGFYSVDQLVNLYAELLQAQRQYLASLHTYMIAYERIKIRDNYSRSNN